LDSKACRQMGPCRTVTFYGVVCSYQKAEPGVDGTTVFSPVSVHNRYTHAVLGGKRSRVRQAHMEMTSLNSPGPAQSIWHLQSRSSIRPAACQKHETAHRALPSAAFSSKGGVQGRQPAQEVFFAYTPGHHRRRRARQGTAESSEPHAEARCGHGSACGRGDLDRTRRAPRRHASAGRRGPAATGRHCIEDGPGAAGKAGVALPWTSTAGAVVGGRGPGSPRGTGSAYCVEQERARGRRLRKSLLRVRLGCRPPGRAPPSTEGVRVRRWGQWAGAGRNGRWTEG
jgi:hypothetical protein